MTSVKQIVTIVCLATLPISGTVFSQTSSHELEEQALELIGLRLQSNEADESEILRTVAAFGSLSEANLNAIERFKKHYYSAYLYYVSGLTLTEAGMVQGASSAFGKAQQHFDLAYRQHKEHSESIRLPQHQIFAKYMISWCQLRKALLPGTEGDDALLSQAMLNLGEVEDGLRSADFGDFLRDDIHFLTGYCLYLRAMAHYYEHTEALSFLDSTYQRLQQVGAGPLRGLTDFFLNLTSYAKFQEGVLHARAGTPLEQVEALQPVFDYFRNLAKSSEIKPLQAHARFNANMALLQKDVASYLASPNPNFQLSELPPLQDADKRQDLLVKIYHRFLKRLTSRSSDRVVLVGEFPEARFWRDLASYSDFVNSRSTTLPDFRFDATGVGEQHFTSLRAQAEYFRGQRTMFAGSPSPISTMPSGLLDDYIGEQQECFAFGWNSQVRRFARANAFAALVGQLPMFQSFESVDVWLATVGNAGKLANSLGIKASLEGKDASEIRELADFLRTVGRNKYAYLLYSFLANRGINSAEMVLLRTFCLYQDKEYESAIAMLDKRQFTDSGNRKESRYYRGRILQDFYYVDYPPAIAEYEAISDDDPRAVQLLVLQLGRKKDVCMARSQAQNGVCMEGIASELKSILRTRGEACESRSESKPVVGKPEVRFDLLYDARKTFNAAEEQQLLRIWQVYSRPLHMLKPDGDTGLPGPREFFLQTDINVVFRFDDAAQRRLLIPGEAVDTTFFGDSVVVNDLKSSKAYIYMVSQKGHFPLIADVVFTRNGQEENCQIEAALKVSQGEPIRELAGVQVVAESNGLMLVNDLRTPHLELRSEKSLREVVRRDDAIKHNYSSLVANESGHFLASRDDGAIFTLERSTGTPKSALTNNLRERIQDPAALAVDQNFLFVSNAADNTILRVNLNTGAVSSQTTPGTFESVASLAIVGVQNRKVFVADWKAGLIYVADPELRSVDAACGIATAESSGMQAPYRVDPAGEWALISDLVAEKIFVFDRTGEFIRALDVKTDRAINAARYEGGRLTLFTADGILTYALEPDVDYEFSPCVSGALGQPTTNLSGLEASRF